MENKKEAKNSGMEETATQEMKKEQFLNTTNKEADIKVETKANQPIPMYLAAMGVIVIILAIVAVIIATQNDNPNPDNGNTDVNAIDDIAYRRVPITMIYTEECKNCRTTNTFEELFIARNIPYTIEKVEASSEEGKKLIAQYGIETAPTALIEADKIKYYATTYKNFENVLQKKGPYYIGPEMNLDPEKYFPVYYLVKVPNFCSGETPTVVRFDDYYTQDTAKARGTFYGIANDFNQYVDFKYSYTQTQSSQDLNAIRGNLFLMCASQQGKYLELENRMTGIYCNNPFKGDPTILTDVEINGCWTISEHYGTPLSPIELDVSLGRTEGIDTNAFVECVNNQDAVLNNAKYLWQDLDIKRSGTYLVDCHETTSLAMLKDTICATHPEIEACSASAEN